MISERYVIVWCDGLKYAFEERDIARLFKLFDQEVNGFIELHAIEDGMSVFLRASAISSFFLSTPESRAAHEAWHEKFDDEDEREPWK